MLIAAFICVGFGCEDESASAPHPAEESAASASKGKSKKTARASGETPKNNGQKSLLDESDPQLKKIHEYGIALLRTRAKFYRDLKKLVRNTKMPPEVMKEEIRDLYDTYEGRFLEHGYEIQSLKGNAKGVILKVDNYITGEHMAKTFWLEQTADRLRSTQPALSQLLLMAYSLPRIYDFGLVRRNDPKRAKRLGLMEEQE